MITIYHMSGSRSLRIVWLMEELGEEYVIEKLSFPPPEDYKAVNPLGVVPAISDDGIVMCESIAILQYITGRRLPDAMAITVGPNPDPADYAAHLQFLHFGEASLTGPLATIIGTRFQASPEEADNFTTRAAAERFVRNLGLLEERLSDGRQWIMGDKFTIADISCGDALRIGKFVQLDGSYPPNVAAYFERIEGRPAYQKALAS